MEKNCRNGDPRSTASTLTDRKTLQKNTQVRTDYDLRLFRWAQRRNRQSFLRLFVNGLVEVGLDSDVTLGNFEETAIEGSVRE